MQTQIKLLFSVLLTGSLLIATGCGGDETESDNDSQQQNQDDGQQNDEQQNQNDEPQNDETCEPGESVSCQCSDGREGVQVCDEDGERFSTCDCPEEGQLLPPTGLTATNGDHADYVELQWDEVDDADEYRVYRDDVHLDNVDETSFEDTNADAGDTPDAPDVSASEGDFDDRIEVSWTEPSADGGPAHIYHVVSVGDDDPSEPSAAAEGYRGPFEVDEYRLRIDGGNWIDIGDDTEYEDADAEPGPVPAVSAPTASQGDYDDQIDVQWNEPTAEPGPTRDYDVVAINDAGTGTTSSVATGYRAPRTLTGYELQRDGGDWIDVGDNTEYADTDVPLPSVDPGEASATSGEYTNYVALELSGASSQPGDDASYRIRARVDDDEGDASAEATGYTDLSGALSIQWQRSDGDNNANFSDIAGATSSTYNDTDAPSDGSGRYYRAVVESEEDPDVSSQTDGVRGTRAVAPSVDTNDAGDIGSTSAVLNADLTDVGIPEATAHGFCYDTSSGPSIGDATCLDLGAASNSGDFSAFVDELDEDTTYHVRAYATHEFAGTEYGGEVSFTTAACGSGTIEGTVCRPDGDDLPDAEVTIDGVDCDGDDFQKTTTADSDGFFEFDDIDAGTHDVTVSSGSFQKTGELVSVSTGQTTDLTGDNDAICLDGDEASIAVINGTFDDTTEWLDSLQVDYTAYNNSDDVEDLLMNYSDLSSYDIVLAECGAPWSVFVDHDAIIDNLVDFVEDGNSMYASDLADEYVEETFPDVFEIDSGGSQGAFEGDVVNSTMQDILGTDVADIYFNLGGWRVVESLGTDATSEVEGDVDVSGNILEDAPLLSTYHDPNGDGQVVYTSFHNNSDATDDMNDILKYVIFQL